MCMTCMMLLIQFYFSSMEINLACNIGFHPIDLDMSITGINNVLNDFLVFF